METLQQISHAPNRVQKKTSTKSNSLSHLFKKHADDFENTRFGWMAILITIQSCLGAAACMYILQNNASVIVLAICACVTMGSNALFIALASPKVCLTAFYLSIILNTIFLFQNF